MPGVTYPDKIVGEPTISALDLNEIKDVINNTKMMPIGTIIMFDANTPAVIDGITVTSGSAGEWIDDETIHGWYACVNGNQDKGCPNLVDRFIMGKEKASTGSYVGTNAKSLALANIPSHNHTASSGNPSANHSHTVDPPSHRHGITTSQSDSNGSYNDTGNAANYTHYTQYYNFAAFNSGTVSAWHTHTITVGYTGSGTSFDNRPATYSIIYIRKCI